MNQVSNYFTQVDASLYLSKVAHSLSSSPEQSTPTLRLTQLQPCSKLNLALPKHCAARAYQSELPTVGFGVEYYEGSAVNPDHLMDCSFVHAIALPGLMSQC